MALGIALAVLANSSAVGAPIAHQYQQTNLVSDVAGAAAVTDANLVNPWGLSRSAASPWWSANNGTGTSTLYTGAGAKVPLTVTIPTPVGEAPPSAPTGTVFNDSGSTTDFLLGPGQAARFLFATEDGTIAGWAGGTTAVTKINRHGWAIYKSLAIGNVNGANYLYAANFLAGTVEVFNGAFNEVHFGADAFRDWSLPGGYAPFNVQRIGNRLYVTYAKQDEEGIDEVAGHGRGYVNAYSLDGVLQLRLHTGYWMNAPWGVALAPANFGRFSNLLLVGQFGSGQIAAFDPMTGHFRGLLRGAPSRPLKIDGLWALSFGNGAAAGPVNTLYFTAGPDEETHGLFGSIAPLPGKDHDADEQDDDEDKP
ncbi:MAG: TIGR03118 family protein [Opitutus sp.]